MRFEKFFVEILRSLKTSVVIVVGAVDRWLQRQASNNALVGGIVIQRLTEKILFVQIGTSKLKFFSQDGLVGLMAAG